MSGTSRSAWQGRSARRGRFCFDPDHSTFLPLNDDYDVSLDGRKVEVRACRESRIPFNRYWPVRQRPIDQTERASYLAFEAEGSVACTVKPKWKCAKAVVRPQPGAECQTPRASQKTLGTVVFSCSHSFHC